MRRTRGPLDVRMLAEAVRSPGIDPRSFIEFGTVDDEEPVEFDAEYGGLVSVVLQPNKNRVRCRVAASCAGKGEGEWFPFVSGDEVIVAIPRGNIWSGATIIGRLTNSLDAFPTGSIAGQDPTTNKLAFKRQRTPFTHECAGTMTFREALGGSFLVLSQDGTVTIKDGSNGALQMGADVFGYQSAEGDVILQMDLTGHRMTLQMEDALLLLSSSKATPQVNALATPGALSVSTSAQPAAEHVITTEAVCNLIAQIFTALGTSSPGPIIGATLPGIINTAIAAALPLAAVQPLNPAIAGAIQAAFAAATQKPPGVAGMGQLKPGVGCVGFLAG